MALPKDGRAGLLLRGNHARVHEPALGPAIACRFRRQSIRLLEERAEKVDTYADLPEGIQGQTLLFYDRRPIVRIAESIYRTRSDHRVRTTATHEFGHSGCTPHGGAKSARLALGTGQGSDGAVWNCHRDNIVNARKTDWVEWQAGWVSGAILMPASALREWASEPAAKFGRIRRLR